MNTQKTFTRLITLKKRNQFYFIGLMEPFQDNHSIDEYKRKLEMQHAVANTSGKNTGIHRCNCQLHGNNG